MTIIPVVAPATLRPFGTRFTQVTRPTNTTSMNGFLIPLFGNDENGDMFTITTYEIVDHVKIAPSVTHSGWGEVLGVCSVRRVPAKGWRRYCGMVSAIPPDEILDLLSPDWRAPIDTLYQPQDDRISTINTIYPR